jgi:hypothetical protein
MTRIKKILLIISIIVLSIVVVEAYVNTPKIILWFNPQNHVSISDVTNPGEIYRTQSLPIIITLQNFGSDSKNALLEIISKDYPTLTHEVWLSGDNSKVNTTFWLPVNSGGEQAFTAKLSWIGPSGICKLEQDSKDKSFLSLAADYKIDCSPKTASRAQEFDWTLKTTNTGNTPANLTVQIGKKDPLIISSTDTQQITNLQVGETRQTVFHFIVPSSASLGDCTITVNLTTTYPDSFLYQSTQETSSRSYIVTIQESPIKTEIENTQYFVVALIALLGSCALLFTMFNKRRGSRGR